MASSVRENLGVYSLNPLVLVVTGRNIDDELFTRACEHPDSFPD